MKLETIVNSASAFQSLLEQPLKANISFRLAKLANKIQPHLDSFNKVRQALFEKYGEKTEEGYEIKAKKFKQFEEELLLLLNEEVKLDFQKFKLSQISKADISGKDLLNLEWLIEE